MEFVLPIFAVAAVVWAFVYARNGSLLVGGTIFFAVGYVLNHNVWTLSLGPISLTLGRVVLASLVVLMAWRWYRGEIKLRPLTGCDWLVALFTGYLTLRCFTTVEPAGIASSVSPTWRLIASFWMPAALFIIARNAELTERTWKAMLLGLTLLGTYLALTGIAEVHHQWWAVFPRFISDLSLIHI